MNIYAIGGLVTRLRLGPGGRPLGRAGVLAASMWIAGVGARMVFYFAATRGAGPAIARFSIAHHITGPAAWTAALVMMALADVLTRLVVVYLRGRRLTAQATPVAATPVPASAGARSSILASAAQTIPVKAPLTAAPSSCHVRPGRLRPLQRAESISPSVPRQHTGGLVPTSAAAHSSGHRVR